MRSLACIGDVAVDFYVTIPRRHLGGISFNVAWNAREHGVDARVYSVVGTDTDGEAVLETFARRGLSSEGLVVREGVTAQQRILIKSDGERVFDGYRTGVLSSFSPDDLRKLDPRRIDALHIPLSDGLEALFDGVATTVRGVPKIADLSIDGPNPGGLQVTVTRYAEYFDLLFIGGRSEHLSPIRELSLTHPEKVFVLTLGSKGVVSFRGGEALEEEAISVERVVDTTGCGEGFQGAFIARWLANRNDIRGALEAGVAQGAKVASFLGATQCAIEEGAEAT